MLAEILNEYLEIFPNEREDLRYVLSLSASSDYEAFDRKNFRGHCTVGAIVVNSSTKDILMLDHVILNRLLPPGGHLQPNEDPLQAAYREMFEETGISEQEVEYRAIFPSMPLVPFDIDTHYIPANPKKKEEEHYHHDLRYLFLVDQVEVRINNVESTAYRWQKWDDFSAQQGFHRMAKKIEELYSSRSSLRFYDRVLSDAKGNIANFNDFRCIVIEHLLPTTLDFLLYLHTAFKKFIVFAKPKSRDNRIVEKLKQRGVEIREAKRDVNEAEYYFDNDLTTPTLIIDIGAYFCNVAQSDGFPIVGIVEDTENGYQKYLCAKDKLKYKVSTVARSPLKDNEDRLVGEAVVHGADTLLRYENVILDYCKVAIIGYGKVGAGIAGALLKRNVQPLVVEKDCMRLVMAVNNYCYAAEFDEAISQSKVIFCATGSKSFGISDFRKIRNGSYLVSVTSSDDEFDFSEIEYEYSKIEISKWVVKYTSTKNYFYVLNDGNAVNFLYGAALGPFIYLVMAEMLLCLNEFSSIYDSDKNNDDKGIVDLSIDRGCIANHWLREFATISIRMPETR